MSTNPNIATSIPEMVSGKQLGFMRALCRELGIDGNAESQKMMCSGLSKEVICQ